MYTFTDTITGQTITAEQYDATAIRAHFADAPEPTANAVAEMADSLENGNLPDEDTLAFLGLDWA